MKRVQMELQGKKGMLGVRGLEGLLRTLAELVVLPRVYMVLGERRTGWALRK